MHRSLRQTLVAIHYPLYQLTLAVITMSLCLVILFDAKPAQAFLYSAVLFASYAGGQGLVSLVSHAVRRSRLD